MFKIISILSGIGIMLASYLLYEYISYNPLEICNINALINCQAVTKGPLAEWFGVPVSLVGLTGYVVIFISSLMKKSKLIFGMASFGMLFCLRLTYLEIFSLKVICPVCIACQLIMLTIFILSVKLVFFNKQTVVEPSKETEDE